jgi:hypothetical protein
MNNNSELQRNVEVIQQSIKELYTLLSVLETQIQAGLFSAQPKIKTLDEVMPEERSPRR